MTFKSIMVIGFDSDFVSILKNKNIIPKLWIKPGVHKIFEEKEGVLCINHEYFFYDYFKKVKKVAPIEYVHIIRKELYIQFEINNDRKFSCSWQRKSWESNVHKFHLFINMYYDLLKEKSIDCIIFSEYPHSGSKIILYKLAKLMGIETIITYSAGMLRGKYIIIKDMDDIGRFETAKIKGKQIFVDTKKIERPKYVELGIKGVFKKNDGKINIYINIIKNLKKYISFYIKGDEEKKKRSIQRICRGFDRIKFLKIANKKYEDVNDIIGDFIVFPLHVQPEATGETLGEPFSDQLSAIEHLRNVLPENVKIIIKENMNQTIYARGEFFYKRIESMNNVFYVSHEIDIYKLIKKSVAVATLLGTAGWEALCMGKPVICYARAWYRNFPGVFMWNEFSFFDIKNFEFNRSSLEKAVIDHSSLYLENVNDTEGVVDNIIKYMEMLK